MELNKIAASILFSGLMILLVSNLVDILYNPQQDIEHQIIVSHDERIHQNKNKIEQVAMNIVPLMQNANFDKGKLASKKCIACHSFEKEKGHKVGPNLWNIIGSKKADRNAFYYSKALLAKGGIWGYEELFLFLQNPKSYIKGTRMAFGGIAHSQEIADLLAYLRTMSDTPVALP
ncbi:c-type cytochrome [Wolbachia endosymbiont of Howardula sp.]|uniref:c-type cytochrome n=1 Tax=Wolbachia endosymbiont of Howardula sp. TaxID=2916816 RepID=UPI00217D33CB|nr:c-type cytochrome [Wolbachia endosymbiont of Howardula sp.]UWI83224.1 c-type cytochrome [Wolbachia endosymbiont of Howardula sp.]